VLSSECAYTGNVEYNKQRNYTAAHRLTPHLAKQLSKSTQISFKNKTPYERQTIQCLHFQL